MSKKPYHQYKTSNCKWFDEVPVHWATIKLKYIASVQFSSVDKNIVEDEEPVQLCNYVDVYHNDLITDKLEFMAATASTAEISKFTLQGGDVLITKDSEEWEDIAVPAYVVGNHNKTLCGYHLAQIHPNKECIDGKYLFHSFSARGINDQFRVAANGITRYGLGKYWIDNGLFPIPPIDEQVAIATFLDRETAKIDALIEKKQRQIELLQEKRAALISHAVTKGLNPNAKMKDSGIEWLGEIPEHWELKKLKYLVEIMGGGTPSKGEENYWNGSIPWVSPKDMKSDRISSTEEMITEIAVRESAIALVQPEAVLVVVRSGILQHSLPVATNSASVAINQDMKALISQKTISSAYLFWLLRGLEKSILSTCHSLGATVDSIEMNKFTNFPLPVPSYVEQMHITEFLTTQCRREDELTSKINMGISNLYEYRTALISAAVTGKIDVRKGIAI